MMRRHIASSVLERNRIPLDSVILAAFALISLYGFTRNRSDFLCFGLFAYETAARTL